MIDQSLTCEAELQFFGQMNASISHEIRNVLAVINENAGLMKDLLYMADKGGPIDLSRIMTLTGKVLDQVNRANGIVGNMNRFAHSIDNIFAHVDLVDCLGFVAVLSSRFAAIKGVILELAPDQESVEIHSSPFLLQNLFYLCIDYAMRSAGKEKKVVMTVKKAGGGAEILFHGLEASQEASGEGISGRVIKDLLERLGAKIELNPAKGNILIVLPEKIGT